ncbi:beta-glucosidase BglX [Prolixibacteraceae bacterium Z1-6]|uniref:beta-glucosidase n=1 Tax=Draconibacterium aestuarii TaxID=2998507 RepID=A0A9X3J7U6_9BACT|nr:beta-glucosidase BglX [Prolixibacteraceae bacterium Z1-6]
MKHLFGLLTIGVVLGLAGCLNQNEHNPWMNDKEILDLIQQMTLEEKIGQMQQINGFGGEIPEHLKQDVIDGKIGSILNEVNVKTINEIQRIALEESRLGIPVIIGRDVIHGFKTVFPIPLGQAATWNPEVVKAGARVAAKEAWSSGVNWTFAPMIDISRDARWGRIAESCGEDPYLTSVMGVAMVEGFQGDDLSADGSILACAKHFAGYGAAEGGRDYNTTLIPEGELRNIYLKSFQAVEEAGAGSFMSGFNDLNGVPASGNEFLLRKVLRNEWNFEGFVVSDWASITEMITHGYVADEKNAAEKAIKAGVDMEMATTSYKTYLQELIDEGRIDEELLDEAVYRILKIKFDLGLFNNPYVKEEDQNQFALPEYLETAKEAAIQSMVLLKNEKSILPLTNEVGKVALIGPMANQKYEQLGTWIFDGDSDLSITPLEALQLELGDNKVLFAEGLSYTRSKDKAGFAQAVTAAKQADVVVMCLGEESILSGEAHCRASLDLPGAQNELIEEVAKAGKPIVLVVMAGRPLAIGAVSKHVDAVLYSFHPGTMGGPALAELLLGVSNPSGKLPVTFPKSAGQIPIYYNHKNTGRPVDKASWTCIDDIPLNTFQTSLGNTSHYLDLGFDPLYPFGFGLSYTTFEYKDLKIETPKVKLDDDVIASVTLENTGNFIGEEVVQLYVRDLVGSVTRPVKELKAFQRVQLKPGESKKITFKINTSELAFFNNEMKEVTEPGEFHLWIGGSSNADLQASFIIE